MLVVVAVVLFGPASENVLPIPDGATLQLLLPPFSVWISSISCLIQGVSRGDALSISVSSCLSFTGAGSESSVAAGPGSSDLLCGCGTKELLRDFVLVLVVGDDGEWLSKSLRFPGHEMNVRRLDRRGSAVSSCLCTKLIGFFDG